MRIGRAAAFGALLAGVGVVALAAGQVDGWDGGVDPARAAGVPFGKPSDGPASVAASMARTAAATAAEVARGLTSGAAKAVTQAVTDAASAASPSSGAADAAPVVAPVAVSGPTEDQGDPTVWSASKLSDDQIKARIADAGIAESDRVALMAAFQQAADSASRQAVLDRLRQLEAAKKN